MKVEELLGAAEALFLRRGYAATTMAAIAGEAGISANSIYWYFPSKDDIFVGVLDRKLAQAKARLASHSSDPLASQLRWALKQLEALAPMTGTLHERAAESTVMADFHARFHEAVHAFLQESLEREGLTAREAGNAAEMLVAIIEGAPAHQRRRRDRDELLAFALSRLVPQRSAVPAS